MQVGVTIRRCRTLCWCSNNSRMRALWISFLLIGSISCVPQQEGGGDQHMWRYMPSPGQYPSNQKPAGQSSGSVGYSGFPGLFYSSGTNTAGGDSGSFGSQEGVPQDSQHGAPGSSGSYQSTDESWSTLSDTSGEDEPVITPVDEEDQVYAFKSRSRYNRKRLHFGQFRYTPTEPRFPQEPVFPPHHGKGPQVPIKGGF